MSAVSSTQTQKEKCLLSDHLHLLHDVLREVLLTQYQLLQYDWSLSRVMFILSTAGNCTDYFLFFILNYCLMICILYFEEMYCLIIWRSGKKFTKLFLEETSNTPTFNSLIRFKLEIIFFHGSLDPIIDDYHDGGNNIIITAIVMALVTIMVMALEICAWITVFSINLFQ